MKIIPVISSGATNILTAENWYSINLDKIALNLEDLLYKPGINYLKKNNDIKKYFAWSGGIILNTLSLNFKNNICKLKSPFDGSKLSINVDDIVRLILKINPEFLILSDDIDVNRFSFTDIKVFLKDDIYIYSKSFVKDIEHKIIKLPAHNIIISNMAIELGSVGKAIMNNTIIDLDKSVFQHDFSLLDESCDCPVCKQKFTKSYFQHLFYAVPFLCIRFLIIHNAYNLNQKKIFI